MSDERSVWLRVTVVDTDLWTSEVGSPITTFETPCGETFRVFSEGLEIVPVSPVRADQEAVAKAIALELEPFRGEAGWLRMRGLEAHAAIQRVLAAYDALRATPEPERAGGDA